MDRIAKTLASYGLWLLILLTCPILFVGAFVVWLVTVPFDRRLRVLHLYSCAWASLYSYVFPYWTTTVRNRERLRNDRAYVVVANHQSLLDILVLFRLYRHFKWVSKEEIFRVPFIGWNMTLNRYIRIRRGDKQDAVRMMAACGDALASGSSIMIFRKEPARSTASCASSGTGRSRWRSAIGRRSCRSCSTARSTRCRSTASR